MQKDHLREPFELVLKELMGECPRGLAQRLELILQNAGHRLPALGKTAARGLIGPAV